MLRRLAILFVLAAFSRVTPARAAVYVLGSSFSQDALPPLLDDAPQWHIDCAKPLQYILDNPLAPCNETSTIWPVALAQPRFEFISFQPVADAGITEQSDLDAIGYWMSLQPDAVGVIHTTWPRPAEFEATFHDENADHRYTNYSRAYFYELLDALRDRYPDREFLLDRTNEMLDAIYHDIENGVGPLDDFGQMFRNNSGHSSFEFGRYLQHNALRRAFGQPFYDGPWPGVDAAAKSYLDGIIAAHPPVGRVYGILFGPGDSTTNGAEDLVWPPDNHTMRWVPRGNLSGVWAILAKMDLPDLRIERRAGGGDTTYNGRYPRVCRDRLWIGQACDDDADCAVGSCQDSGSYWEAGLASHTWINTVVTSQGVNDCALGISPSETLDNLAAIFQGILQDPRVDRIVWWKNTCYHSRVDILGLPCARDQFESTCSDCNHTIDGDLIGTAFAGEPVVFFDDVYEHFGRQPRGLFHPDQGTNRQCHANNFGQREEAYLLLQAAGYPVHDHRPRIAGRLSLVRSRVEAIVVHLDPPVDRDGDPLLCVVWASCADVDPDDTHPDPSCAALPRDPGDYGRGGPADPGPPRQRRRGPGSRHVAGTLRRPARTGRDAGLLARTGLQRTRRHPRAVPGDLVHGQRDRRAGDRSGLPHGHPALTPHVDHGADAAVAGERGLSRAHPPTLAGSTAASSSSMNAFSSS